MTETVGLNRVQEERVVARFSADRNEADAEENEEDQTKLRAWLDKIVRLDFYDVSC